ncbi:MAG: hypothetical protein FWF96_04620, partial [Kiritimatiellaeota bacterium]|nr:hypothetical protein [Kiritimatiellota bacterium]
MRSKKIAEQEWFPDIRSDKGSYNALPHILNVERHADDILSQANGARPLGNPIKLSPGEKYLLLASILFHDLGRTNENAPYHGTETNKILKAKYSHLGIENAHLARAIGIICEYHNCKNRGELPLWDYDIAPHG